MEFGDGLTVVTGPNGAGKTNLLEGLYFGCTGRSCRTSNEREVVRFGAGVARTVLTCGDEDGTHELSVGFVPGQAKAMRVDGASVERMLDVPGRPLVSVFLPDRLELIEGAPAARRAHLDQFVAALWPARTETRRLYSQALAQRNALIARIRSGRGSRDSLESWDAQLARHGIALMSDRRSAVDLLTAPFERLGGALGSRAIRRRSTGRARGRPSPPSWSASSASESTAISSAASPATGRTATTSRRNTTGTTCAPMARRGSSDSPYSRCCRRARGDRRASTGPPADAPRRRYERARPRPAPGARRLAALHPWAVRDHRHRSRARARFERRRRHAGLRVGWGLLEMATK